MTPRSKHYAIKYHWFRTELKSNDISIAHIDSADQMQIFLQKVFVVYYLLPIGLVLCVCNQNGLFVGVLFCRLSLGSLLGVPLGYIY